MLPPLFLHITDLFREPPSQVTPLVPAARGEPPATATRSLDVLGLDRRGRLVAVLPPARAARQEHNDGGQQRADGRRQRRPRRRAKRGVEVGVVVDVGLDDAEEHKVDDHDDHRHDEGQECNHASQERPDHARAEGEEEGDEVEAAGDGVQDHGPGERSRRVAGRGGELGGDAGHVEHASGRVADSGLGTIIAAKNVSASPIAELVSVVTYGAST